MSVVALTAILTLISYTIYTIDSPFGKGVVLHVEQLSPIFEAQLKEFEEHEEEG